MVQAKEKTNMEKAKIRNTIQREKIKEFLQNNRTHPTAEDVFNAIKKDIPTITLATVYRNLHFLADKGEILRFEVNKEYHFDIETEFHFHFVCENNGKIIDIFPKDNNNLKELIRKELDKKGLELYDTQIFLFGRCKQMLH